MTVHVTANSGCNIGCEYCYETPDRELKKGDVKTEYDMDRIMERLHEIKEDPDLRSTPGLHGGEPTLIENKDLEKIFKWVDDNYEEGGHIQTNGTLIDEELIDIFDKYNVSVGMSMDGPEELNYLRKAKAGGEEVTEKTTQRTQNNMEKLIQSDVSVGLIVVLHAQNAGTDERLEKLLSWLDWLSQNDVHGHYNPANPYQEGGREPYILTAHRVGEVYVKTWEWMQEKSYRKWDPMHHYQNNLLGYRLTNCVNGECDVYNTKSASIVKGDGEMTGCAKTWAIGGDGGGYLQGRSASNKREETRERYEALQDIPGPYSEEVKNGDLVDQGGCKGCRYWSVCNGGCPAGTIGMDHRNRARLCYANRMLYERIEKDLRNMYPNVQLTTDTEWDFSTGQQAPNAPVHPFARMQPDTVEAGTPSVYEENKIEATLDELYHEHEPERDSLRGEPFDHRVGRALERAHDPSNVSADPPEGSIHIDSDYNDTETTR